MARKPVETYPLELALEHTASLIRQHGYISKKDASLSGVKPTSGYLRTRLAAPALSSDIEPRDVAQAKAAMVWLDTLASSDKTGRETDFEMAIRRLSIGGYRYVATGMITKSDFGFVACVYSTMDRMATRAKNKEDAVEAASESEWIGKLKKRDDFFIKLSDYTLLRDRGCYLYKICDRRGNLGVFFSDDTPKMLGIDKGDCFLARMTPKYHNVSPYHKGKETQFNRIVIKQNVGSTK